MDNGEHVDYAGMKWVKSVYRVDRMDRNDTEWALKLGVSQREIDCYKAVMDNRGILTPSFGVDRNGERVLVLPWLRSRFWFTSTQQKTYKLETVAHDLCMALKAIHSAGWLHRDIKPDNVLFNDNCEAYLIDFGSAVRIDDDTIYARTMMCTSGFAPLEMEEGGGFLQIFGLRGLSRKKYDWDALVLTIAHLGGFEWKEVFFDDNLVERAVQQVPACKVVMKERTE